MTKLLRDQLAIAAFLATLLLSAVLSPLVAEAQLSNPYDVPQVQVRGLEAYKGLYLSAFYVSGNPSSLATQANHVHVREVYAKIADIPVVSDTQILARQSIEWLDAYKPNILMIVIHEDRGFTWENVSGSDVVMANGIPKTSNTDYVAVSVVYTDVLAQSTTSLSGTTAGSIVYTFDPKKPLCRPCGSSTFTK